jgi:hypothetical protein
MAPSKSLKLVSSCLKIDFRAKLSGQKFLRILPQTWINHKISMLACCIIDFPWLEFEKWICAIFRRPQNSQGVDFSFSNLKQQFQIHPKGCIWNCCFRPNFRYSTQCLLQIEDSPDRTKVSFRGSARKRKFTKIIISKGIAHRCVRLLKAVNSPKYTLAPTLRVFKISRNNQFIWTACRLRDPSHFGD